MRHLASFLFGLVLAPVIWFLAALGQYRLVHALPADGAARGSALELVLGGLLMAAGGVWLGLLLGSRLSPLGPGIAGLLWLGAGAAFVLNVDAVLQLLPDGPTGQRDLYELPLRQGYAFLIGTGMLVPLFSPNRWRGSRVVEDTEDEPRYVPFGPVPEPATGEHTNGDRTGPHRTVGRVVSPTGEISRTGLGSASGDVPRVGPGSLARPVDRGSVDHGGRNGDRPAAARAEEEGRAPLPWGELPRRDTRTPWKR
jgi:hypothetical protein